MGTNPDAILPDLVYESPTFEVGFVQEDTESEGWAVVIGAAAIGYFVWRCYQGGGRPTVGRAGWFWYVSCN